MQTIKKKKKQKQKPKNNKLASIQAIMFLMS